MRKDDVLAALNEIDGTRPNCEVCNANVWGGIGAEEAGVMVHLQATDPAGAITPGAGLECAPLVCNKCGNVRLHAIQMLQRG